MSATNPWELRDYYKRQIEKLDKLRIAFDNDYQSQESIDEARRYFWDQFSDYVAQCNALEAIEYGE